MVFYAYVKQITDNVTYRYTITFDSREVADEWWRAVSTSTVTSFITSVQRVNAQFYTHNVNVANAANSLTTTGVATDFLGKVFFTLENDLGGRGLSIIPPLEHFADHISGNSFFIRSKVAPYDYWYYPTSSNTTNASHSGTAGTVMIGSDDVVITLTTAGLSVNVDATTAQVILSLAPLTGLTLSTLLTNFTVGSSLSVNDETVKELLYTVNGEEWELA
ncbi:uncharacterized protein HD556DRAFT_1446118 [Suillus plorans]|uniref:Uncharacterized protein n=1 Tax=Suillus plorans TaxID=116603 RepID=A0A9P7AIQ8_9AGAM|nr:uncharacterized protein HD556DRAFT_1446118 [Suillus plorans]KAG1790380.1 hypothetical protein HD556DRAFT_1446118 [Suillus plorans]